MELQDNKPVKLGQKLIIKTEMEGAKGDAIHKIQNYVIIIKNGRIGKKYEIEIMAVYGTYAFAKIRKEIKEKTAEEINKQIEKEDEEDK